jgi:hypothetical protein
MGSNCDSYVKYLAELYDNMYSIDLPKGNSTTVIYCRREKN